MDKNVILIGMPGCGKTTIGKLLAEKLKLSFLDMDEYIEKKQDQTIESIFNKGEDYFRKIEEEAVYSIKEKKCFVISTGGGVIKSQINIKNLKENGYVIFINRDIEDIYNDVDTEKRPLLKDKKDNLYKLYNERLDLYRKYCDIEIKNKGSIEDVLDDITDKLKLNFLDLEKSCGAVVFEKNNDKINFLLIRHNAGHWAFPKGHVENHETEEETAKREVYEETGIKIKILKGFKTESEFAPKPNVMKKVILFLGEAIDKDVTIQIEEVQDYKWLEYEKALDILTYENDKKIIKQAYRYLNKLIL
ncbi:MAG: shikimate kinase [Clostridiaceae bacterium]